MANIAINKSKGVTMATMNVSLPDEMKIWVEAQAHAGRYSNSSDYVRDLIRHDQERAAKVAHMQQLVDQAYASGEGQRSMKEIEAEALARLARRRS